MHLQEDVSLLVQAGEQFEISMRPIKAPPLVNISSNQSEGLTGRIAFSKIMIELTCYRL
jgi:hypothetical protein